MEISKKIQKNSKLEQKIFNLLDKFETRKVVFDVSSIKYGKDAITKAVVFELLWLKSKRRYYSTIKAEDEHRIIMIEKRLNS